MFSCLVGVKSCVCSFSALTLLVVRQEGHPACKKTEWWSAGVVICLERGADLHVAQLMPLPLTVSCSSKIQTGFTFLVPADPGSPGQRATKRVCVCKVVCVCVSGYIVFSGVRRANGVQGLRVIVQSDKSPDYVETRVELFLHQMKVRVLWLSSLTCCIIPSLQSLCCATLCVIPSSHSLCCATRCVIPSSQSLCCATRCVIPSPQSVCHVKT